MITFSLKMTFPYYSTCTNLQIQTILSCQWESKLSKEKSTGTLLIAVRHQAYERQTVINFLQRLCTSV